MRWLVVDVVRLVGVVGVVRVDEVIRVVRVVEVARVFGVVEVIRVIEVVRRVVGVFEVPRKNKRLPHFKREAASKFLHLGSRSEGRKARRADFPSILKTKCISRSSVDCSIA